MTREEIKRLNEVWLDGHISGLTEYAWWKDGVQYVGTCGTTLEQAISRAKKAFATSTPAGMQEEIKNLRGL